MLLLDDIRRRFSDTAWDPDIDDINFELTAKAYAPRVVAGVAFLERKVPLWASADKLALSDLDLSNGTSCVLGQLAAKSAITSAGYELRNDINEYMSAVDALGIRGEDYGFNYDEALEKSLPQDDDDAREDNESYWVLNHLWTAAIRRIRKGKKVSPKRLLKDLGVF